MEYRITCPLWIPDKYGVPSSDCGLVLFVFDRVSQVEFRGVPIRTLAVPNRCGFMQPSGAPKRFLVWRQLFNAIAALSTDALKRSSWYRKRVTRSARSVGLRWNRGRKAPTSQHTSLLSVRQRGPRRTKGHVSWRPPSLPRQTTRNRSRRELRANRGAQWFLLAGSQSLQAESCQYQPRGAA
jgi:hypothetical protein